MFQFFQFVSSHKRRQKGDNSLCHLILSPTYVYLTLTVARLNLIMAYEPDCHFSDCMYHHVDHIGRNTWKNMHIAHMQLLINYHNAIMIVSGFKMYICMMMVENKTMVVRFSVAGIIIKHAI